jgi:general stress protein YciG
MANSGNSNPGNFANDRQKAAEAGQIGGQHQGKGNNPANFANDRGKAAEAGRSGGQSSHGGRD